MPASTADRLQTLNSIQDCMDEAANALGHVDTLKADGLLMHEAFYIMNGVHAQLVSIGRKIGYIGTIKTPEHDIHTPMKL